MPKELTVIQEEVSPLIKEAEVLEIKTKEDLNLATDVLSKLNTWNDQVIEDKELLTKPLNATLKEIRGRYKPVEELLQGSISTVRTKMITYQTQAEKERKIAETAISQRIKPGKGNLSMETAVAKLEELGEVDKRVIADKGEVTFMEVKKFEVVDILELANRGGFDFIQPHETNIRAAMKAGKELPGVKYWIKQVPRNFR